MGTTKWSVELTLKLRETLRRNQRDIQFDDKLVNVLVLVYDRKEDGMRESEAKHFYRDALRSNTDFACVYVDRKEIKVFAESPLSEDEIELRDRSFRLSVEEQAQTANDAPVTPKRKVRMRTRPSSGKGRMVTQHFSGGR